jgi:hypothetical protein
MNDGLMPDISRSQGVLAAVCNRRAPNYLDSLAIYHYAILKKKVSGL